MLHAAWSRVLGSLAPLWGRTLLACVAADFFGSAERSAHALRLASSTAPGVAGKGRRLPEGPADGRGCYGSHLPAHFASAFITTRRVVISGDQRLAAGRSHVLDRARRVGHSSCRPSSGAGSWVVSIDHHPVSAGGSVALQSGPPAPSIHVSPPLQPRRAVGLPWNSL
jgi:hypothetical protein